MKYRMKKCFSYDLIKFEKTWSCMIVIDWYALEKKKCDLRYAWMVLEVVVEWPKNFNYHWFILRIYIESISIHIGYEDIHKGYSKWCALVNACCRWYSSIWWGID